MSDVPQAREDRIVTAPIPSYVPKFSATTRRISETFSRKIPSQASRKIAAVTVSNWGCIYEDWNAVNTSGNDLLYVGKASNLQTRLHPMAHGMWSVISDRGCEKNTRIAIWFVPPEFLNSVEGWMMRTCAPLWSNGGKSGDWTWRDPDCVFAPREFDPYLREQRPLYVSNTSAIYAWLFTAEPVEGIAWVHTAMLDGAFRRQTKRAEPERVCVRTCSLCNSYRLEKRRSCEICGATEAAQEKAARELVNKMFDEDVDE